MITSHATSEHKQRNKAVQTDGELLASTKELSAARKQVDAAYKRICGEEDAMLRRRYRHFNFKKS